MGTSAKYISGLILLVIALVVSVVRTLPDSDLKIIACDVGQGDAILIIQGDNQILTDGGANNKVLDCLSRHVPFWDRKIEMIILSHPQKDHFWGLIEVFERYEVEVFVATQKDFGNQEYILLKNRVGGMGVRVVEPRQGVSVRVGLIHLDILHPLGEEEVGDPNDVSVVHLLKYGDFEAVFTGDLEKGRLEGLVEKGLIGRAEYIKIPHHGSRNSLSGTFLNAVNPVVAVISSGKNNTYGHPHKEVLDVLEEMGVAVLRTDISGDVVVETDGNDVFIRK